MSISIIGGSDGPTSIFLAGSLGADWINVFGLVIVILLLIPNIVYAIKFRKQNQEIECSSKAMTLLEQIGRYASMFFMVFPVGIAEFGFSYLGSFLIYGIGNILLLIAYWFIWILYFYRQAFWKRMALAIIPTGIFLLSGITLMHILLLISGILFGISHIYITHQSRDKL